MKKIATALVLTCLAAATHAAVIGWSFGGTLMAHDGSFRTFGGSMSIDTSSLIEIDGTGYIARSGASILDWRIHDAGPELQGAYCVSGGWAGNFTTSADGFSMQVFGDYDCMLSISVRGVGIGEAGPFDDIYASWDREYDFYNRSYTATVWADGQSPGGWGWYTTDVRLYKQSIPEPASLALFGVAGLAGLIGMRRRKSAA